jgi:glycosyltransferase involved in cell wall biosynthesis
MRIFIGVVEIANVAHNYAKGFRTHGVDTFTVVDQRTWAYGDSTYDVVIADHLGPTPTGPGILTWLRRLGWRLRYYGPFLRAAATCDVFIFLFGSGFRADRLDYWLLRKLGKRIVSVFLGDDTRYWYAYTQEAELNGTASEIRPYLDEVLHERAEDYLAVKLATVRDAEHYSDLILSLPEMGQLQTRPYMRVNIPIDLSTLRFHIPERDVPLVVHAPSVRGIKGTDYVLAAVERLRSEGVRFDFRLVERTPNALVRELLSDSDILVDQLYSETIATLALEGLATGNAVLARYLPERSRIGPDCPVVNVTIDTLTARLRELILDPELRRRLAHAGRRYVEQHHAKERVTEEILRWLRPGGVESFHFEPTFFRDHFVMCPEVAAREAERLRSEPPHVRAAALDGVRFQAPRAAKASLEPLAAARARA